MALLTTSKAAQMLGMTPDAIRYHERSGHLLALKVDQGNGRAIRLFLEEDIERFQKQRLQRAAERKALVHVG